MAAVREPGARRVGEPAREPDRAGGRAFGLEVEGSFPAPGLLYGEPGEGKRRTFIEVVPAGVVDAKWDAEAAVRLHESHRRDGTLLLTIDEHHELGYRLFAPEYGCYLLSRDAAVATCVPSRGPSWRWQGFLIGQVLPAAAAIHGLEVLHASAVALAGHAVVIMGPSRAGKSSLAVNLLLGGASFLADDVVAFEAEDGAVLAHPGAGLASIRHAEANALGPAAVRALGHEVGRDKDEIRVVIEREPHALPLGVMYFVERDASARDGGLEESDDPRLLLANTFTRFVLTHERLENHLDVCARISRTTALFRVIVPPGVTAAALAEKLRAHALALLGKRS